MKEATKLGAPQYVTRRNYTVNTDKNSEEKRTNLPTSKRWNKGIKTNMKPKHPKSCRERDRKTGKKNLAKRQEIGVRNDVKELNTTTRNQPTQETD